ncbi:MAG: hypothetical protein Q9216_005085 [Gyalolechia sp. 2 TL-2023]
MATVTSPKEGPPTSKVFDMPSDVKPAFFVSTYTASQFYQPLPPKWLKMKTPLLGNFEKPAKEALKALETLADVRVKLNDFDDTEQIDILIDHKINMNAQFTPRNAFDYPEELQLERLARLTDIRRKLADTDFGLASIDDVLKKILENLILATGIARSHSVHFLFSLSPSVSLLISTTLQLTPAITVPDRPPPHSLLPYPIHHPNNDPLPPPHLSLLRRPYPPPPSLPIRQTNPRQSRQRNHAFPPRYMESDVGGT